MFDSLRDAGYFVETLGSPLTCFDAAQYGTLLMVDLEDEYYDEEIEKLKEDVETGGLGLIVFADWYHVDTMVKMKFFDDNTRSWWTPFGIAFRDTILNGVYSIGGERAHYASGTDIQRFPAGGFVHRFLFQDHSGGRSGITSSRTSVRAQVFYMSPDLSACGSELWWKSATIYLHSLLTPNPCLCCLFPCLVHCVLAIGYYI
jgi:membrane-bound transcription factor site-1 protease